MHMRRFLLLFLPLTLLVVALTAYLGWRLGETQVERFESREAAQLKAGQLLLEHELAGVLAQLQGLDQDPALLRALAAAPQQARARIEELLQTLLYRNVFLYQARWIGPDGMERARVVQVDATGRVTAPGGLQDKSDRPYFTEAMRLQPGQLHLSALDLNVEHGRIEVPHRPTLRLSVRLWPTLGQDNGLLVVNLEGSHLLKDLAVVTIDAGQEHQMLLNSAGGILQATDPQQAWGEQLGRDNSLARRQPQAWARMAAAPSGRRQDDSGLWLWETIEPASLMPGRLQVAESWKLVTHLEPARLRELWWGDWPLLALNAGVILLLLGFGLYRYSRLLTARDVAEVELKGVRALQQSQAELLQSNEWLELAKQGAGAGFWDWNMASGQGQLNWSSRMFQLFGVDPTTVPVTYETWRQTLHPDDLPGAEAEVQAALTEARPFATCYRVVLPGGKVRWIDAFGQASYDEAGRPRHFSGLCLDATERKQAEQALRELNADLERQVRERTAQFQLLAENASDVVYRGSQSLIEWVSPSVTAVAGWLPEQMIGHPYLEFVYPDDVASVEAALQSLAQQDLVRFETRVRTREGGSRWISVIVRVIRDADGSIQTLVGGWRDIQTEVEARQQLSESRQQLEQALAEATASQARFRAIFEQAPIGIALLDPRDGQIQDCNERYAAIAGRSVEELLCIGCMAITHPDDLAAAMVQMGRIDVGEIPSFQMDARFLKPDGSPVWVRRTVAPVQMDAESGPLLLCMVQDISQQKQAAQELLAAKEAAEQASRTKSAFVANMSHEVRTPMNAVLGFLDILADSRLDAQQRGMVEKVQKSSRALLRVLNDILDFSKLDAGAVDLEQAPLVLEEVLSDSTDLLALTASTKGVELVLDMPPGLHQHYRGDALRLGQVLVNLLGNAVKFTEQGSVNLAVREEHRSDDGQALLRFEVRDSGIGLTPEQVRRLFQPFAQADSSTTRRFGGTGLGLTIAKRLVELMGGEIGVISEPGQGATFWFTVRLTMDTRVQAGPPATLRQERVLLVDDHESVLEILSRTMRSWGFSVDTASDAETALEMLMQADREGSHYSMLVSDWSMPGHDGLWLLRQMHERLAAQDTPVRHAPAVLMMTAYDRLTLVQAAASWPVQPDAVLSKPVSASRLYDTVLELQQRGQVQLPVARGGNLSTLAQRAAPIRGAELLLVEDNPINQEVALALLGKMGLRADVANHGGEALQMLSRKRYDLVLMDLQMPVMDGFEATALIRAAHWGHTLPVVAMTAAAFADDRRRVLNAGMNDFVSKPVDSQQLLDVLLRWLPHRQPQDSATAEGLTELTVAADPISTAAPAMSAEPQALLPPDLDGFDLAGALERFGDDQSILLRILRQFQRDYQPDDWGRQLEAACRQADWISAQRHAHTLKGVAGNLGAVRVQQAATALEALLKTAGDQSGCDPDRLAQRRDDCLQALRAAIAVLQDKLPAEAAPAQDATGPAQPEAALQDLAEAEQLLRRNRGLPAALLPRLRAHLGQHQARAELDRLSDQVRAFDFAGALETIRAMRESLSA